MKQYLLEMLLKMVMMVLKPAAITALIDKILDFVEDAVAKSETTMDDVIVLPMCKVIREALNVPDNDD